MSLTRIFLLAAAAALVVMIAPASANARKADPDRYIVVLEPGAGDPADVASQHGRRYGLRRKKVFRSALKGYAGELPRQQVAALERDSRVAYVERDALVKVETTQSGATWGLDRVDQRLLPLTGSFSYTSNGQGVTAYIIDTGIHPTHQEFGGRAVSDLDFVEAAYQNDGKDCNGHGTHVAGTVGGSSYGVAKGVSLVGVRVLDCDGYGYNSEIIAGLDWITANNQGKPAVANMSLGGGASTAIDDAVKRSIASGVSYAVAAGNGNAGGVHQDACKSSPARVPEAITISATDSSDRKASWANYGKCVDWFAPGVAITSAWHTADTATTTISGTSMATPHTAGVAALYLQSNPGASPQTVRDALYANTTKGIVKSSRTPDNNHLLFTSY